MRTLLLRAMLVIAATLCGVTIAAATGSDPVVGTWQLNSSKSTFTGGSAPKSQTRTYSQSGKDTTVVIKTVGADGKESTSHTTFQANGKDFPVTGNPDFDTLSVRRVNANTAKVNFKKGGKPVGTTTRTVSKDGKTLTTKSKLTTANGERSDTMVFDKQ